MIVALLKDMSYQGRMSQSRSTGRLNSRVPVAIEWTEAGGKMRAEGSTVDISAKGCMAVVPQGFTVGQRLRLVNLTNQHSCEAILVWRGHEGRTGWVLGMGMWASSRGSASRFSTANGLRSFHFFLAIWQGRNVQLA